jgi:hypothetical protein
MRFCREIRGQQQTWNEQDAIAVPKRRFGFAGGVYFAL